MKRFYRALAAAAPALAAVMVFVLGTTRCTSVDDTLGQNFIPPYQQMKLRIDTLTPVKYDGDTRKDLLKTYLAQNDSVVSSNQGLLFVGSRIDPVFGGVTGSAMTDFFPYAIGPWTEADTTDDEDEDEDEDESYFGYKPAADSIFIDLIVNDVKGKGSVDQTFNVYELRDSLYRDSMYYFTTPIEDLVDINKPLFSFEVGTDISVNSVIRRKLIPTDAGLDFMKRLVETDDAVYDEPLYKFHKLFHGLYFAPAPDSEKDAALYEFDLRDPYPSDPYNLYAVLTLWAHNYNEADPAKVLDTLVAEYRFTDTYWKPNPNLNVNRTVFTYPPAIAGHLNDTLKTSPGLATVYAQGLGGVTTYLRFTDDMQGQFKEMKKQDGIEYSEMVINEARIYFPMDDPTVDNMNIATPRLGMYYTYGQPRPEFVYSYYYFQTPYYNVTPVYGPIPMADYSYYAENNPSSATKSAYDGYIYRTQGYYKMNITKYMTLLLTYPDQTPREIWLGPEINTRAVDYTQVALKGSEEADNPIRIVLTYTLIK